MTDSDEEFSMSLNENYIENTEEFERALSALKTPRGKRLKEIANAEHNQVSVDVLRKVALDKVQEGLILIESDGEKDNPRLYRNRTMGFMQQVWEVFAHYGSRESLKERRSNIKEEIEHYQEETGYDNSSELRDAIKNGNTSHIEADSEIFWEYCSPWANQEHRLEVTKFAIQNYEVLDELRSMIPMEVEGAQGDFTNLNGIRAKLGIDDDLPTEETIDENGNIK